MKTILTRITKGKLILYTYTVIYYIFSSKQKIKMYALYFVHLLCNISCGCLSHIPSFIFHEIEISPLRLICSLRVFLDEAPGWRGYSAGPRKIMYHLVYQLSPFLDWGLQTVIDALVTSQLDYCNTLYIELPLKTPWKQLI